MGVQLIVEHHSQTAVLEYLTDFVVTGNHNLELSLGLAVGLLVFTVEGDCDVGCGLNIRLDVDALHKMHGTSALNLVIWDSLSPNMVRNTSSRLSLSAKYLLAAMG